MVYTQLDISHMMLMLLVDVSIMAKYIGRQWNGYFDSFTVQKMLAWYITRVSNSGGSVMGYVDFDYVPANDKGGLRKDMPYTSR